MSRNVRGIILAAGKATRFKTDKSKLLHSVCGQPMVLFPIKVLESLDIPITMILGYQEEQVKAVLSSNKIENIDYVTQTEQKGTGHAVLCSKATWDQENILVLNADTPLITQDLILDLIKRHKKENCVLSFLTTHALNPTGYGRVIKENGKIRIVEEKNCNKDQLLETRINTGIYLISKDFLENNIIKLQTNSVSGEIYLTDLVELASEQNLNIQAIPVAYDEVRGINTLQELWAAEQIKRSEIMKKFMDEGVRFELAQSIHLDINIEIGKNSFIGTGVHLLNGTKIGQNCSINAFSIIENSTISDNCKIHSHTIIQDSVIGKNANIGPFARLRDNNIIKENVTIGNFVEVKNSQIDHNTKAKHLTYLGDAKIGKSVNIGAGTITCNYDGKKKHTTTIEDNCFIGSNNSLIAPVKIGKNSYTAAGSAINKDVPENSLAIARNKQENKINYLSKEKKNKKEEKINFIGATKSRDTQENL